jgi:hypothetical protein
MNPTTEAGSEPEREKLGEERAKAGIIFGVY